MLVNQINELQGITQSGTRKTPESPNTLDEYDFYQLLITQLQNQNPLDPLKPDEFVAQLSQFAQLEAIHNMESHTELLANYQASINNLLALSLLGKEVKAEGNVIYLKEGEQPSLHYSLSAEAEQVAIKIYDSNGNLVRTLDMGQQSDGEHTVLWDGEDDAGHSLPQGEYTFAVVALTADGAEVKADTYVSGKVTGAEFNNDQLYLQLNGTNQIIGLSRILTVNDVTTQE
ncbi:MAG: flagellar hook assembly protein FlgD [Candidatus Desulfofervidaceae bacterium]|nr:flagellar hook assembly protein FlgD [Candidatus Desulfofervidaceae bacterium]